MKRVYGGLRNALKTQLVLFSEEGPFTPFGLCFAAGLGTASCFALGYSEGKCYSGMSERRRKEAIVRGCFIGGTLGILFGALWPSFSILVPGYLIYRTAEFASRGKYD
jgi:hypothetical protein